MKKVESKSRSYQRRGLATDSAGRRQRHNKLPHTITNTLLTTCKNNN